LEVALTSNPWLLLGKDVFSWFQVIEVALAEPWLMGKMQTTSLASNLKCECVL
jgi:hypothetical protein